MRSASIGWRRFWIWTYFHAPKLRYLNHVWHDFERKASKTSYQRRYLKNIYVNHPDVLQQKKSFNEIRFKSMKMQELCGLYPNTDRFCQINLKLSPKLLRCQIFRRINLIQIYATPNGLPMPLSFEIYPNRWKKSKSHINCGANKQQHSQRVNHFSCAALCAVKYKFRTD